MVLFNGGLGNKTEEVMEISASGKSHPDQIRDIVINLPNVDPKTSMYSSIPAVKSGTNNVGSKPSTPLQSNNVKTSSQSNTPLSGAQHVKPPISPLVSKSGKVISVKNSGSRPSTPPLVFAKASNGVNSNPRGGAVRGDPSIEIMDSPGRNVIEIDDSMSPGVKGRPVVKLDLDTRFLNLLKSAL